MIEGNQNAKNGTPEMPNEVPVETKDSELQSCIDRLKRLQAEFENYRKRTAREVETLDEQITDQVLLDVLVLYDNLERAFQSYGADQNIESFVTGIEQIFAQFARLLERRGVERIASVGSPFDPSLHEALLTVASEEEKNTIVEEFEPGYRRNGRVLRPSKVAVSQGPTTQEDSS